MERIKMGITFNADEIFEIAEEIERSGASFYRQAAKNAPDKTVRQLLLDMAVMEDEHLATFQKMREELSKQEKNKVVFDPDNEAVLYLQAMADAHGSEGRITPAEKLTGKESLKKILEIALNSEKESVVYYFGLKNSVPAGAGRDKIEAIILEELSHITTLLNKLEKLD
ncbi:MAG: ferritin family protein [Planctomycetota bacterium]|jgi:rubrerythrin